MMSGEKYDSINRGLLDASLVGFVGSMPVSIAFCQISLGVGWLAWLIMCWREKRWLGHATGLDRALGLFLAACALATVFSPQPLASLIGMKKFYLASGLYLTAYSCRSLADIRKLLAVFLFFAALSGAYGLAMHLLGTQSRVTGTQTMALTAGGIFMMAGLVSSVLAFWGSAFTRWLTVPGSVLLLISLLFTQSASSLISFVAGLGTALAFSRRWRLLAASAVALAAVAAIFLGMPSGKDSTVEIQKTNTWELRKTIWSTGLRVIAERPVTGHGLVDLGGAYRRNRAPWDLERDPWNAWNYGHLHNNFLQMAAISGMLGLAAFIFLLYRITRTALRAARNPGLEAGSIGLALAAAVIGFIVNGLAEWNFGDSEVVTILWFMAGLSVLVDRLTTVKQGAVS